MKYFEIIGPSGSGKTTLFNLLKKRNRIPYLSINKRLFYFYLLKLNKFTSLKRIIYTLLYFLIRSEIIYKRLISRIYHNEINFQEDFSKEFGKIYYELLNFLFNKKNPIIFNQYMSDYIERLKFIHILSLFLKEKDVIILEEGIVHKNPSLRRSQSELDQDIISFLKDKVCGIIYLNTPMDRVTCFSQKRLRTGIKTISHKFLDQDSLNEYSEKHYSSYKKIKDLFYDINIPILNIHFDDNVEDIEKKIIDFIKINK